MSKAAELANLIGNINSGGGGVNRNLIINGAMNVAQRGSQSMAHDGTTSTYACDRFLAVFVNMDELDGTLSQDSSAPDGFANSLKWATGTGESSIATTEYYTIMQKIEAQNLQTLKYGTSGALPITLTFYVKSSITGTYGISLQQLDVSRNRGSTYTINSADTWEKKTITFSGDTSGVINDDNGEGLRVEWHLAAGATYTASANSDWATNSNGRYAGSGHAQNGVATTAGATWFLSGVQLEIGQNATEFEHEPYAVTKDKCLRYYWRQGGGAVCLGSGTYYSSTNFAMHMDLPVPMRIGPTHGSEFNSSSFIVYSNASVDYIEGIGAGRNAANESGECYAVQWDSSGGNGTQGHGGIAITQSSGQYIDLDAEL